MVRMALASLLFSAACSTSAHADQPVGPMPPGNAIAIGIAPAKIRAPYDVQVIREGGDTLPTYAAKDRFYVQGNAGERYIIRVTNPTANRVEAVVSVDGLDVIDGESGDLRKRGYVVPPHGEVRIEGFRMSQADVATFRFSSVNDSYAGKQGKARNVGVIAVAIFEEHAQPEQQIIVGGDPAPGGYRKPYDYRDDLDASDAPSAPSAHRSTKSADGRRGETAKRPSVTPAAPTTGGAPSRRSNYDEGSDVVGELPPPPSEPRNNRPGLGTEFGEQRQSAASFTRFVRNAARPIAIAELRYNNSAGLLALGIDVEPLPDNNEIMTRETADPFPGDSRYAHPPR